MRVIVKSVPSAGFRCAGNYWPATETEADLDEATVARLKSSPHLVVVEPSAAKPLSRPVEITQDHGDIEDQPRKRKGR
jgi:hypothetical protein